MTKDEIFEKYGAVKLKFTYYYKYRFTFVGHTEDGEKVLASIGGDSGDIYRLDIDANAVETINTIDAESVFVTKDKNIIVDWNDY